MTASDWLRASESYSYYVFMLLAGFALQGLCSQLLEIRRERRAKATFSFPTPGTPRGVWPDPPRRTNA